jgi:transcriptional regulator with XRE-family HTH domain
MKNWTIQVRYGWRKEWEEKITRYLALRVKQAREEKGLSQRELSEALDRSKAYISQIEGGRLDTPVIDLLGMAFLFEKPLKYFLPIEEQKGEPVGEELELLDHFRRIPDDAIRETAVKQVAELAKLGKRQKATA